MFSDLQNPINTEYRAHPEKNLPFCTDAAQHLLSSLPYHSFCNFLAQLFFLYFPYCLCLDFCFPGLALHFHHHSSMEYYCCSGGYQHPQEISTELEEAIKIRGRCHNHLALDTNTDDLYTWLGSSGAPKPLEKAHKSFQTPPWHAREKVHNLLIHHFFFLLHTTGPSRTPNCVSRRTCLW